MVSDIVCDGSCFTSSAIKRHMTDHPKLAKSLQGLREGYMKTGKNELALKYLKESLNINPKQPFHR